jgi:hypothetical protein
MMQKACAALQLSRAMVFRLLARYREDRRLSALLLHPRGRKCGSGAVARSRRRESEVGVFYRKPQTSEIHPRFADVVETFAKNRERKRSEDDVFLWPEGE